MTTYYQDQQISITEKAVTVGQSTYPVAGITSVSVSETKTNKALWILILVFGLLGIGLGLLANFSASLLGIGTFAAVIGGTLLMVDRVKYAVVIGQTNILTLPDHARAQEIAGAIKKAMQIAVD